MALLKLGTSLLALGLFAGVAGAQAVTEQTAERLVADALVNDARIRGRSDKIPAALAASEAELLLRAAVQVDPQNLVAWSLLAEAYEANDHNDQAREAYKQMLKLDPQNYVAQVRFLETLADDKPVEQQLKVYVSALASKSLHVQVRSEAALRAGKLNLQRGEVSEARRLFLQAIDLNRVNIGAWQALCRLEPEPGELAPQRLKLLISMLGGNPYQPDALLTGATLMARTSVFDSAADWQMAAVEQLRLSGQTIAAEVYLDLAMYLCIAGRRLDAEPLITELLKIDDAPLTVSLLSLAIRRDPDPALLDKVRQRLTDALPKDTAPAQERIAALTDALWVELAYASSLSDQVEARLEALRTLTNADNPTYRRLFGWRLLRLDKPAEARKVLEPLADTDEYARLGLARAAEAMGDHDAATTQIQEIWRQHPLGLLAVMAAQDAEKYKVKLTDSSLTFATRSEAAKYPKNSVFAHRQPRDLVLITPSMQKNTFMAGEPVTIKLTMTNTTDHALALGANGAVPVSLMADAAIRGTQVRSFNGYAIENSPRTYRLEPGESLAVSLRADQGSLRQWLEANPSGLASVSISVTTNPVMTADGSVPGLGGQTIFAGDFDRVGFNISGLDQVNKMARDFDSYSAATRLQVAALLQSIVPSLPDQNPDEIKNATTKPDVTPAELKVAIINMLKKQYKIGTPLMQAWLVRNAPRDLPADLVSLLDTQADNSDSIARMMWYDHLAATLGSTDKPAAIKKLNALAEKDKDSLSHDWALLMAQQLDALPAETQTSRPATTRP